METTVKLFDSSDSIKRIKKSIEEIKEKFKEDFLYWSEWKFEDLYKEEFKLRFFKECNEVEVSKIVEYLERLMTNQTIMEASTSTMHRQASLWRFEVYRDLWNFFKRIK